MRSLFYDSDGPDGPSLPIQISEEIGSVFYDDIAGNVNNKEVSRVFYKGKYSAATIVWMKSITLTIPITAHDFNIGTWITNPLVNPTGAANVIIIVPEDYIVGRLNFKDVPTHYMLELHVFGEIQGDQSSPAVVLNAPVKITIFPGGAIKGGGGHGGNGGKGQGTSGHYVTLQSTYSWTSMYLTRSNPSQQGWSLSQSSSYNASYGTVKGPCDTTASSGGSACGVTVRCRGRSGNGTTGSKLTTSSVTAYIPSNVHYIHYTMRGGGGGGGNGQTGFPCQISAECGYAICTYGGSAGHGSGGATTVSPGSSIYLKAGAGGGSYASGSQSKVGGWAVSGGSRGFQKSYTYSYKYPNFCGVPLGSKVPNTPSGATSCGHSTTAYNCVLTTWATRGGGTNGGYGGGCNTNGGNGKFGTGSGGGGGGMGGGRGGAGGTGYAKVYWTAGEGASSGGYALGFDIPAGSQTFSYSCYVPGGVGGNGGSGGAGAHYKGYSWAPGGNGGNGYKRYGCGSYSRTSGANGGAGGDGGDWGKSGAPGTAGGFNGNGTSGLNAGKTGAGQSIIGYNTYAKDYGSNIGTLWVDYFGGVT